MIESIYEWIVLISEMIVLILAGYSYRLLIRFYSKTKVKFISLVFFSILALWIVRVFFRLTGGLGILPRLDTWSWSIIGVVEITLIVILFNYKIKLIEKYIK